MALKTHDMSLVRLVTCIALLAALMSHRLVAGYEYHAASCAGGDACSAAAVVEEAEDDVTLLQTISMSERRAPMSSDMEGDPTNADRRPGSSGEIAYIGASYGENPPPGVDPADLEIISPVLVSKDGTLTPLIDSIANVSGAATWLTYAGDVFGDQCLFGSMKGTDLLGVSITGGARLDVPGTKAFAGDGPIQNSVTPDGRFVVIANFVPSSSPLTSSLSALRIGEGCSVTMTDMVKPNCTTCSGLERKGKTGLHGALAARNGLIYGTDLAADLVRVYALTGHGEFLNVSETKTPEYCGPRYSTFHPYLPILYVFCEMDDLLLSYRASPSGALESYQNISTPLAYSFAMSSSGRNLYTASPGGDGGQTITAFKACPDTGLLTEMQTLCEPFGEPRGMGMAFGSDIVLVASITGELTSYAAEGSSGTLAKVQTVTEGLPASPGSIAVAPQRRR